MLCRLLLLVFSLLVGFAEVRACAQQDSMPSVVPDAAQEPAPTPTVRHQALKNLAQQLLQNELELSAAERQQPVDPERVVNLQTVQKQLRDRLASLATGFDVAQVRSPKEEEYELQTEILRLVRPLVRAISKATEGPRQIQELQSHREQLEAQIEASEQVVRGLERTRRDQQQSGTEPQVLVQLDAAVQRWGAFVSELRDECLLVAGQLESLEAARAPMSESVQNAVADFVRRRGVSLFLAIAAAALVILFLRWLHRMVSRIAMRGERRLPLRMFDVAFQGLAALGAAFAVVAVFYLRGDFELLAVAIVFLIGLGWALSRSLPTLLEQVRLLLNAGAVREGERVMIDGLPYRVDALRLQTRLSNPELQGGVLRIPLREVVGRSSRKSLPDEPWFPCQQGEWVMLANGAFGPVEVQTPDQVVVRIDGAPRTFRTTEFLGQMPSNLSRGFFILSVFGIDYRHQEAATTTVPEQFAKALHVRLPQVPGGAFVTSVVVEFAAAAASSLDLQVVVRFSGEAAASYGGLRRGIQRILVEAATQHGVSIPFPQLTIHRA